MCSDFSLDNTNNTLCSFSLFPFGKRAEEFKLCTDSTFSYIYMYVVFHVTYIRRQSTPRRGVKHRSPRAFPGDDFESRSTMCSSYIPPRGYLKMTSSRGIISIQYLLYSRALTTVVILHFSSIINLSILL